MAWNKTSLLQFCYLHQGRLILLEEQSNRTRVQGQLGEVVELDLCSTVLYEAMLALQTPGLEVALTFHDEFVGVHVMASPPQQKTPELLIPWQITYEHLNVSVLAPEAI